MSILRSLGNILFGKKKATVEQKMKVRQETRAEKISKGVSTFPAVKVDTRQATKAHRRRRDAIAFESRRSNRGKN